jgi:hypothetical protein
VDTCADSPVIGLEPESHPKLAMGCAKEQLKCASSTKKSLNNFFRRGTKKSMQKNKSLMLDDLVAKQVNIGMMVILAFFQNRQNNKKDESISIHFLNYQNRTIHHF